MKITDDIGIIFIEHDDVMCSHLLSVSIQPHWRSSLKEIMWWTLDNIEYLPKAMCILYGLTSARYLNYPKSNRYFMLGHSWTKTQVANFEKPSYNVRKCEKLPWEAAYVLSYKTLKCVLSLHISAVSAQLMGVHNSAGKFKVTETCLRFNLCPVCNAYPDIHKGYSIYCWILCVQCFFYKITTINKLFQSLFLLVLWLTNFMHCRVAITLVKINNTNKKLWSIEMFFFFSNLFETECLIQ